MANKFISHLLKERNLKDFESERTVEVSEDVLINCIQITTSQRKKVKLCLCFLHQKSSELSKERDQLESLILMIKKKRINQDQRDKRKMMKEIKGLLNS